MRTAIRRGWLDDAPQAERDALAARFAQAMRDREATDYATDGQRLRVLSAEIWAGLEMNRQALDARSRLLRYAWAGELTDRDTGRPRERFHVADYSSRIDANELRRRALADGVDLRTLHAIDVRPADKPDGPGERIALAVVADTRYGVRLWLVCSRCKARRLHLYPGRAGVRCRRCAGIDY